MNTSSHKLSFVIAAYNEAPRVGKTIERVLALQLPWPYEIIVVDDGSKDETANVIRRYEPRVHLIQHDRNYGFGKAFRTGCAHATGDIIVRQDSDLEYPPEETINLIEPIADGRADVVYGFRAERHHAKDWKRRYQLGGNIINATAKMLYGFAIKDFITAAKAFRREVWEAMQIGSDGFEIESETTAKAKRMGYRILCIPYSYFARSFAEGKKIRAKHAIPIIRDLFYWRVAPIPHRT